MAVVCETALLDNLNDVHFLSRSFSDALVVSPISQCVAGDSAKYRHFEDRGTLYTVYNSVHYICVSITISEVANSKYTKLIEVYTV